MEIYILIYSLFILSCFFDQKKIPFITKKWIIIFWGIIFALFRGLRWECGTDWDQFYYTFLAADWDNIFNFNRYGKEIMEPGYMLFSVLVKQLGGNYTTFLLLSECIAIFCFIDASLRYSKYPIIAFIGLILCWPFFPTTRQYIASAIILYSYRFLIEKDLKAFIICVIAAASMHTSAIIAFPFYFILHKKLNYIQAISLLVSSLILSITIVPILNFITNNFSFLGNMVIYRLKNYSDIRNYDGITAEDTGGRDRGVLNILINFIFISLYYYSKERVQKKYKETYNVLFNAYLICIFITNVFSFSHLGQLARLQGYFNTSGILLSSVFSINTLRKRFPVILFYILFILFMLYKFTGYLKFYPHLHFPYHSIFD